MKLQVVFLLQWGAILASPQEDYLAEQRRRVAALIEALGNPDIEVRVDAQDKLRKMLPGVEPALRQNVNHPDAEVAARSRDLLAGLERAREAKKSRAGKVALCDEARGLIAVDLSSRDGVKRGDPLDVIRGEKKVGTLMITDVQVWGYWTKPFGDTKIDDVKKGDQVERAEKR